MARVAKSVAFLRAVSHAVSSNAPTRDGPRQAIIETPLQSCFHVGRIVVIGVGRFPFETELQIENLVNVQIARLGEDASQMR